MVLRELKKAKLNMSEVLVGTDDQVEEVMEKLKVGLQDVRVVGICGMGGIGKTTLAKVIYNKIVDQFKHCCFLNDVREISQSKGIPSLQRKLASDILRHEHRDFANVDEGINVLCNRLRDRKALILLDDVNDMSVVKALVSDLGWFGPGSRIIITTREKEVLNKLRFCYIYEVKLLSEDQALELFSKHAFGDAFPPTKFHDLSCKIVRRTGSLPLALEVIGSNLSAYRGCKDIWEGISEQLTREPHMDVLAKLKISYESLGYHQKEMFLDIACFFSGEDIRDLIPIWDEFESFAIVGIEILQQKSLIRIIDGKTLWMHDQLQHLGRHIVEEENRRAPELRSRLWQPREATDVLIEQQRPSMVEAIKVCPEEGVNLTDECFRNLPKLRILELIEDQLDGTFLCFLPKLRFLRWWTASGSLPANLHLKYLTVLDLSCSDDDEEFSNWFSIKMEKLKVLDLSCCEKLRRIPNISSFPALERLILKGCENLVSLDSSIGLLKSLKFLDLSDCKSLKELPKELRSLEALTELLVDNTLIKEMPISEAMKDLEILSANDCCNLNWIPASVGLESLINLKQLSLSQYVALDEELMDYSGPFFSPGELLLQKSGMPCSPGTRGYLEKLEVVDITGCSMMDEEIPFEVRRYFYLKEYYRQSGVSWTRRFLDLSPLINLKDLSLHGCFLKEECLAKLRKLERLILKSVNICMIPEEIGTFSLLKEIQISYCEQLKLLPALPSSLYLLEVTECPSLERLPNISNLTKLSKLYLVACITLKEINGLENLVSLELLYIDFCPLVMVDGLEKLDSLVVLDISMSGIGRLPELSKLQNLRQLKFSSNIKLVEIQGLDNLSKVEVVGLIDCRTLEVLPKLADLKSMVEFDISHCIELISLPDLSRSKRLRVLTMKACEKLQHVESLELESLEVMDISRCKAIERLPDLSRLQRLKELNMEGCEKLHLVEGLRELVSLEKLTMSGCKAFEDLPNLSRLQGLRLLLLERCENLRKLQGLEGMESLERLDMSGCIAIQTLPCISRLQRLKNLKLEVCEKLRLVEGLEDLISLEVLDMRGCKSIESLPDLSRLQRLRYLRMESCEKLHLLAGLGGGSLEELNLSGCKELERLPGLSRLQRLRELKMEASEKIRLLDGLEELESLEVLNISWCTSIERLPDLSRLQNLKVMRTIGCKRLCQSLTDWETEVTRNTTDRLMQRNRQDA